jgi:hypothetical protein
MSTYTYMSKMSTYGDILILSTYGDKVRMSTYGDMEAAWTFIRHKLSARPYVAIAADSG